MDTPVMAEVLNQVEREAGKYCSSRLQAFVGNQSVKVPLVENSEWNNWHCQEKHHCFKTSPWTQTRGELVQVSTRCHQMDVKFGSWHYIQYETWSTFSYFYQKFQSNTPIYYHGGEAEWISCSTWKRKLQFLQKKSLLNTLKVLFQKAGCLLMRYQHNLLYLLVRWGWERR